MAKVPEYVRKATKRWDSENMATLSCRIPKADAKRYRQLAAEQGTSIHAVIKALLQSWEQKNKGGEG